MPALTKGLTWPFLLLALATWAVFLGGLASLQNVCNDYTTQYGDQRGAPGGAGAGGTGNPNALANVQGQSLNTAGLLNVFGFSAGPVPCTRFYRFYWFMMAFELIIILGAMVTAVTRLGLHYSRPFWIGMFSIATLLFMIASEAFLAGLDADAYGSIGGTNLARMRTAAAGAIMTVAANIFVLFAIGTDWEGRKGTGKDDVGTGTGTGTGVRTGPHVAVTEPVGVAEPLGPARV
jgi:uncharacterized spore protein YtfJ